MYSSTSAMRTQRHGGAALRQDIDQTLGLQAGQRLGDREARDAQALADGALVDHFAGFQIERDDGAGAACR